MAIYMEKRYMNYNGLFIENKLQLERKKKIYIYIFIRNIWKKGWIVIATNKYYFNRLKSVSFYEAK